MNVGVVDVYEVDLGAHGWSDDVIDALVPPHERTASHASRVVRALTRHLLGLRLVTDPAAVPITRVCERCGHPAHGRPRLAEGPVFGATHSGDRALVAVADGPSALGVDLEVIRPRADLDRLAARVLDRVELATWRSGPAADALERFLAAWTAREAYLKALGVGIATDLRAVPARPAGWWVTALPASAGCVAALAVPGGALRIVPQPAGSFEPWVT